MSTVITQKTIVREVRTIFPREVVANLLANELPPDSQLPGSPVLELKMLEDGRIELIQRHTQDL